MTLPLPTRPDTEPQTHALLIGVGAYPHLPDGDKENDSPAAKTFGLGQLTSPPVSACDLADWLLTTHDNPSAQLGSVELLLSPATYTPSPGAATRLKVPATPMTVGLADLASIKAAFGRWYVRLNKRRDNVGLFYFCGHGVESGDRYLLPADFGANPFDWTERLINFTTTHGYMESCKAGTQCYFLDACRDRPDELAKAVARGPVGQPLIGPQSAAIADRDGPIYHAAAPGRAAEGPPGKKSYFARALIDCLNGMGAGWPVGAVAPVDHATLERALPELVSRLAEEFAPGLSCVIDGGSQLPQPSTLHLAPMPVDVLTIISCNPATAQPQATLTLKDASGTITPRPKRESKPWRLVVSAGKYEVEAQFDSTADFDNAKVTETLAAPPLFRPHVPVSARIGGGSSGTM